MKMPKLFGREYSKTELRKHIGDMSQIAGAVRFCYSEGKAGGTEAIEIRNGSGLRFVVLPGRGMDIAYAEFQGLPYAYISKTGIVNSCHYDETDFFRSFSAGLLTTCGLTYMGSPCVDEGISLGAHGRISNTPAFDVGITQEWCEDDFVICVRGKISEATVFGENIILTRTITTKLGDNRIMISDQIENQGFISAPLMILYHFNFGFPLLSANTAFITNCTNMRPRDAAAESGVRDCYCFSEPIPNYAEQVFYYGAVTDSIARLENCVMHRAVELQFNGTQLPYMIEWKQVGEQEYVVGIEPATYPPDGRSVARKRKELLYLQPQHKRSHIITIKFE